MYSYFYLLYYYPILNKELINHKHYRGYETDSRSCNIPTLGCHGFAKLPLCYQHSSLLCEKSSVVLQCCTFPFRENFTFRFYTCRAVRVGFVIFLYMVYIHQYLGSTLSNSYLKPSNISDTLILAIFVSMDLAHINFSDFTKNYSLFKQ